MSILVLLLCVSLGIALFFLVAFIWSVQGGQFDDQVTPAIRMLNDDAEPDSKKKPDSKENPDSKEPDA